MLRGLTLLSCLPVLSAFHAAPAAPRRAVADGRGAAVSMGSSAAVAKKAAVVEEVVTTMEGASLMFCVRSEGIKVNEMNALRQKFPEDVTVRCVKNTLVKRAAEEVPRFQGGDELLKRSNYWFFVPESDIRETVETWNDFISETKKEDNAIVGGMFEGQVLTPEGIEAVTKLPTKQELMGQTAMLVKALPTKLARLLNEAGAQRIAKVTKQASGQKLVQAIKAVEGKMEEE